MIGGFQRVLTALGGIVAIACLAPHATAADAEPALAPGVETAVPISPSGQVMKVYLPSNYSADQRWPAIFYYHSMGGTPDTMAMRRYTDGRDYIVVGLPYVADDAVPRTAQGRATYLQNELNSFHSARTWVTAHAKVDQARVFMAGASKGGWTVSTLGEMELPGIGGMIILLAGRQPGRGVSVTAVKNLPIYIGVGETDPNLVPARGAREFYRRNGAIVTFEEYAGTGHEAPADAKRLKVWLQVHGRYGQNTGTQAPPKEATAEVPGLLKAALAEPDAMTRYNRLLALTEDPRLRLCDQALIQQLKAQFAVLVQSSPAKEEWTAESTFNELVYREMCIERLADMKAVLAGYKNLAQTYPQTHYGKLAAQYTPHMEGSYEKSMEATRKTNPAQPAPTPKKAVTPTFPTSGVSRGSYLVPVQRGNKITFERPGSK